jgi:hypothetical protein
MNVVNNGAVARATAEHTRLENWAIDSGTPRRNRVGPSRSCRWRDDPHQRYSHRCQTPARSHSQSRVPVGKSRSDLGATAPPHALQPRRSARNRCTSQFDSRPRRAQTLISRGHLRNHFAGRYHACPVFCHSVWRRSGRPRSLSVRIFCPVRGLVKTLDQRFCSRSRLAMQAISV